MLRFRYPRSAIGSDVLPGVSKSRSWRPHQSSVHLRLLGFGSRNVVKEHVEGRTSDLLIDETELPLHGGVRVTMREVTKLWRSLGEQLYGGGGRGVVLEQGAGDEGVTDAGEKYALLRAEVRVVSEDAKDIREEFVCQRVIESRDALEVVHRQGHTGSLAERTDGAQWIAPCGQGNVVEAA